MERNGYLGGQPGSGLPFLAFWDIKGRQVVGGIAQEFVDRPEQAGASYGHEYCPHHQSVTLIHPFYSRILCFEMVKEAGVELLMHCGGRCENEGRKNPVHYCVRQGTAH